MKKPRRQVTLTLDEGDEIIEKEVKKFGGRAGHIIVSEKHIGKKALIILTDEIKTERENHNK